MRGAEQTSRLVATWGKEFLSDPLISHPSNQWWTLPMVLAFIKWRTLDAVCWFSNEELEKRRACIEPGYNRSHFVSQRDLRNAEDRLGPPLNESVALPFNELQWAGKGGRITANAIPLRNGDRREIAGDQWVCLRLADDVMELFHEADPDAPRYSNIFIDRQQCLSQWGPTGGGPIWQPSASAGRARRGRRPIDPEINSQIIPLITSGMDPSCAAHMVVHNSGKYSKENDLRWALDRARKFAGKFAEKYNSKKSEPFSNSSS